MRGYLKPLHGSRKICKNRPLLKSLKIEKIYMKYIIDTSKKTLCIEDEQSEDTKTIELYSNEAFALISKQWLKVGWNQKYSYTFSWMGRPMIQLPEDMIRYQEVIFKTMPDVILETGIAHGGSLVYSASLCKTIGKGRVIGIDIDIRPHNRAAIESHELSPWITLIEGSSTNPEIVKKVKSLIQLNENTLVMLDSNHSKQHVFEELEAYHDLVPRGGYIVATDGIMQEVYDAPRGKSSWFEDNPIAAVKDFIQKHPEFIIDQPHWPFNESYLKENVTHWPCAWLRRI